MKGDEVYCVIFNKYLIRDGLVSDSYTLGSPSVFGIPTSIILSGKNVIVTFDNKTKHIFARTDNVELFYREIEIKEDGTVSKDRVVKKRGRPRRNPA